MAVVRMDRVEGDYEISQLIDAMVSTKADCWSYEQEWRIMHVETNLEYGYDARLFEQTRRCGPVAR